MSRKREIYQITFVFFFITIVSIFFCCAPRDPADIASKVAEKWAVTNVDSVSGSIAKLIANENPLVETAITMTIAKEINQRIAWEYSPPKKLADERYEVIATAFTGMELPLLGSYRVSVNYKLEIDTKQKQVITATMDVSSFAMRKQ